MPTGNELPSYDELAALVAQQAQVINELRTRVAALEAENAELKRRLGMNSTNSSQPPSTDGLAKPVRKSLRGKTSRRPGGQAGHPGSTLTPVAVPDEVIRHEPAACGGCGGGLTGAAQVGLTRRQVFDLPEITVRVTEHQAVARQCGCGTVTCGVAPDGVDAPVSYGPRIAAITVYLYVAQFLSKKRTAQALAELFGTPVSTGTVSAITRRAAAGLGGFREWVRERITASEVVHFDETGLRVAGQLRWVHSASTGKYALIWVHDKRGRVAMDAAGVLPAFTGIAVHDAWAPYDCYPAATHALCNAHLLRELVAVVEQASSDERGWCWAEQVRTALLELKTLVEQAIAEGTSAIDATLLARHTGYVRSAALIAANTACQPGDTVAARHRALARRILDRQTDYLRFATDFRVPFDNNAAEREIRMVRLREKVSGCLRTLTGAHDFAAIRSYLATAAKHGMGFLHVLTELVQGNPWLPVTT
ncbi:MAG TPA: IS66 family transposase [Pseudonocardiaceae bacterium]|nr:IS66 family transposase [Pseudonocardiaceae bacterium]